MDNKLIEFGNATFHLVISGTQYLLRPVKMAQLPSSDPHSWLLFMRGNVSGAELSAISLEQLKKFMRANNTEAVTDGVSCFTLAEDRLAYCDPLAVPELPSFRVLGAHPNSNFFSLTVQARDGLSAFGAAALLLKEAGSDGSAEFYAAVPSSTPVELPGDSVVSLETVLDPEQAQVFGLAPAEDPLPEALPELMMYVLDRLADGADFNELVERTGITARVSEAISKG